MPVTLINCKLCKSNGVEQVKIPDRKPYCCRICWEAIRHPTEPSFRKIEQKYENRYGIGWYDNWPLED